MPISRYAAKLFVASKFYKLHKFSRMQHERFPPIPYAVVCPIFVYLRRLRRKTSEHLVPANNNRFVYFTMFALHDLPVRVSAQFSSVGSM